MKVEKTIRMYVWYYIKGGYKRKNDPENVDFRWGSKYADSKQLTIESAWGI